MNLSSWNPKPSDYARRFGLAAKAIVAGLVALLIGLNVENAIIQTIGLSAGVGLLIGAGAIALSTWRSLIRAKEAERNQ